MATTATSEIQEKTSALVYRDFINNPQGGGAIRVHATPIDHNLLATYVNLGHVKQYTPSTDSLNGLYALEVSLQAICVRLGLPTPDFFFLRGLYLSDAYERAARQIAGVTSDPLDYEQMHWDLLRTVNLSRDAMRLVLVLFAMQINARLRLGVLSWGNDLEGRIWHAATYPELIPSHSTELTPFTVWVIDDARYGDVNPERAVCHWSGMAPQPLYAIPLPILQNPNPAEQRGVKLAIDNSHAERYQRATSPGISSDHDSNTNYTPAIASLPNFSADLAKSRTEYPSHLSEEEVLDKYSDKMSMEILLYVLLRYRQSELLEELRKRNVIISSETLRQRKKAALDNRARYRYGMKAAKHHYKDVSREYNDEILQAGWYEPRAERSKTKRKRNYDQDDQADQTEKAQRRKRVQFTQPIDTQHPSDPRWVPTTGDTVNPEDIIRAASPVLRPFYRSDSFESNTTVGIVPQATVSPPATAHPPASALYYPSHKPGILQKATAINLPLPGAAATSENDGHSGEENQIEKPTSNNIMTEEEFAALLKASNAAMEAAAADGAAKIQQSPLIDGSRMQRAPVILSGKALQNFFTRSYPHSNGRPDSKARNGRGAGPPGRPTWFRWPKHRLPPELTLEQIDWYFREGRDQRLLTGEKEQLLGMRKTLLDDTWYSNRSMAQKGQSQAVGQTDEVIEISDDEDLGYETMDAGVVMKQGTLSLVQGEIRDPSPIGQEKI